MTTSDEILHIDTPENVVFGYQVAGIGSRFLAGLIDVVLLAFIEFAVIATLLLLLNLTGIVTTNLGVDEGMVGWVMAIAGLLLFAFFWGYYIFFEILWNGQTPGKRRVGLRVIRTDGQPAGPGEIIIRNLVRIIDLLPSGYALGILVMFLNAQSRRLGDLAAGTLVIYDHGPITLQSLQEMSRPQQLPSPISQDTANRLVEGLPLERLQPADYDLIDSFLQRRHTLINHQTLAQDLCKALLTRMGIPLHPPPYQDPVNFLYALRMSRGDEGVTR